MKKFHVIIEGTAPLFQARHLTPTEQSILLARESGRKQKVKDLTAFEKIANNPSIDGG